jgi:hypothetical protein
MASVPMGIVLVAALVVPLAVIPGTFGFDRWPSSRGARISERQVQLAPPKIDVVAVRPRRAAPERHPVPVSTAPHPAPAVVALAPAPRRTTIVHVQSPKPDRAPRPSHQPQAQPAPQPQPAPAQQPAPEPSKSDSGLLAGRDAPVAREAPAPAPQPAPEPAPQPARQPVQEVAPQPVARVAAPEPCHGRGEGGGQRGDGDSQQ